MTMQGKVSVEREKYRDAAQGPSPVVSAMPAIHINDQMKMSASDASYTLRYLSKKSWQISIFPSIRYGLFC